MSAVRGAPAFYVHAAMGEDTRALTPGAPAPLTAQATRRGNPLFPDGAAKHWLLSSIIWLTIVDLFGLVLATEFVTPEAFGGISFLSFSRIRPAHVNGVILAWLTMMYFGALFYMLPRLVGTREMWSERLGIICCWAWNLMYLLGVIGLLTGHSQGREYAEFIWPIDIALLIIWCANIVNILATVAIRTIRPIYVSVWFFIASPLWLAVDYAIGNVIWDPGNVWGARLESLRRHAQLVVRPQPVRTVADPDVARADVLHRPAGNQHSPLQLHALPRFLLGHGVLLHGSGRPPHPPVADAVLAEDDRGGLLLDAARPGLRVHDQHPRDDEGQLGPVLHELTAALHDDRLLLLLPGEHPGGIRGDPAVQQADALYELRRRPRPSRPARRVHDPRDGRDRLHGCPDQPASPLQPQPLGVAVLVSHGRVHRVLQRVDA